MDYYIKEYNDYNEQEVLSLYKSVGWVNYTQNQNIRHELLRVIMKMYEEDGRLL